MSGKYDKYEDIPCRVRHEEMEVAKSKFRVEAYFLIIVTFMITALWSGCLLRSEKVKTSLIK